MANSFGRKTGKRVLVAEDNQINLLYIETLLRDAGYHVLTAEDGEKALSLLEREVPDLVLMDIQMPRMDGIECARRIRSNPDPKLRSLPIIAVTGYAMETDKNRCLEAGMNGFLPKPFGDEDLIEVVSRHWGEDLPN